MLGKNLEKLIRERKTNKTAFCKYLDISRTTLQEYLCENTHMTSDKIVKTAVYFGVSVASLFGEVEDNYSSLRDMLVLQQKQLNELNEQLKHIVHA
jgi:transcriptional regulator with XRE-family HTH domain